jgi:hypothetical protein
VDNKSHDKGIGAQSHGVKKGYEGSVSNQGVDAVVNNKWLGTGKG